MAKNKVQEPPTKKETGVSYYAIKLVNSGYAIFSATGERLSEPDVFQITQTKLMQKIRKDLGI